ncbi:hypothetical protein [Ralstonia solanacearum]|uniref:hypothetical protein n=1 Tax=Ralstonia solanacearum TaxID=305 RepID=UPI003D2E7EBA
MSAEPPSFSGRQPAAPYFKGFQEVRSKMRQELCIRRWVERWFGLITQQAIRRGSFKNVRQLIADIERYIEQYNQHKRPFVWTATAGSILQKVARLCKVISGTEH